MSIHHVDGTNAKNSVFLYALSTCPWCKKTKALLNELNVKYDYIDVDLIIGAEQDKVVADIEAVNPQGGFPTLVINKTNVIVGYRPEEIKEALA
ncbi:glutaredoxin family protein [Endomicrobium proavitum]|uniref:Glutaredoxin-like protein n=1 Tax=Endomicrobium proavitum TaxID=1408281 RepID=A0A0G3WGG7_9BACT|nr:glutaredoxin family protein [Endomicrobium proavitum]AKL97771.1 Glutaredoxin-like protein [Endomicrobium proavitum]